MGTHTPGPWQTECDFNGSNFALKSPEKEIIGGCGCCGSPRLSSENLDADAALIESAPDLLAALQDLLPYGQAVIGMPEGSWPSDSVVLKARAAIAKATGAGV